MTTISRLGQTPLTLIGLFFAAALTATLAAALVATLAAALTETPAAALAITPTVTFVVKLHAYKASTTLTH